MMTINIPKIARFEVTIGGRGKMKFTTGSSPGSINTDIGIQKSFLQNKLSVTLKFDDVFDTKKFVINTENIITPIDPEKDTYTQIMNAERRRQQRYMSININYNFGKQQKKKWNRRNFGGRGGGGGMDMDY